jgi:exodeoxyribonuclease V beta subunit
VTRRTLRENFRSEPGLVAAVNALFDRDDPFLVDAIEFDPATAAARCEDDDAVVLPDSLARPFTLWYAARGEDGKAPNKDESRRAIAAATAGEIARLLEAGRAGSARIGGDSLSGHHVAVLVKSHYEAAFVRAALAALRVPSVTYGQQSVFASHEAMELERVLLAVAHPTQEGLVRAALATDLLGATATAIATFDEDERRLERALEDFARYRDIAQREDFARMLRTLAVEREVAPRLLALDDGERRLINLLHLAELLESAAVREGLDLDGVVRRLAQARTAPMGDAESEQLRLESDEHLVSVLTIHAAKGLQFPIVFCPFLWSGFNRRRRSRALAFHEPETGRAMFDLAAEPARRHVELAEHEGLAESLRLAYVALTRAERRVVAVCGALKDWECSPLAWLLFGGQALAAEAHPVAALVARVKSVGDEELRARLDALVRESKGEIVVQELPRTCDVAMPAPPIPLPDFAARPFLGRVRERWRVTSYSGLVAQSNIESADHDALALPEPAELTEVTADASTLVLELPHGARFGEAVHALFETVDFTHLAPVEEQARGVLARFGLAPGLAPILARLVADVVATRLDAHPALRLADVPRARRIEELEFVLPTGAVAAAALTHALAADRTKAGIAVASEDAVASVAPGYLRGFVDLVFAADGRYWLADYKSNWLGPRYDDYAPDALARAMAEHLYDLQALLYVVAVDRYLATRVPGYDYERHFGGVFYLFVRGMRPDATGPTRGVHFLKPAAAVVRSLSAAMARRERTMP